LGYAIYNPKGAWPNELLWFSPSCLAPPSHRFFRLFQAQLLHNSFVSNWNQKHEVNGGRGQKPSCMSNKRGKACRVVSNQTPAKKKRIKINAGKKKYKNKREFKGAAGCVCGRVGQLG